MIGHDCRSKLSRYGVAFICYLRLTYKIMPAGRPLKFQSVQELQERIDSYFSECEEKEKVVSVTGLALYLDTSRETLLDYQEKPEFSDAIKKAKLRCENWVEEGALSNKVNATSAIFNLKNNFGWKDKQEMEHSGGVTVNLIKYGDNLTS